MNLGPKERALFELKKIVNSGADDVEKDLIQAITRFQHSDPTLFPDLLLEKAFEIENHRQQKSLIEVAVEKRWDSVQAHVRKTFATDPKVNQALLKPIPEKKDVTDLHFEFDDIQEAIPDEVIRFATENGFVKPNEPFSIYKHHTDPQGHSLLLTALSKNRMEVARWLDSHWPKEAGELIAENEDEFEALMLFKAVNDYGDKIQTFLQSQKYTVNKDFQYDPNDKKLQQLLVIALNSEDEEFNMAAKGLLGLGVRLPKVYVLNDKGNGVHFQATIKASQDNLKLMAEQQKIKMHGMAQTMLTALQGKPNVSAFLETVQEIAPQDEIKIPEPIASCGAFQGGGPRGACYNGVSTVLEKLRITKQMHTVAGSSAGAITAFGFSLGFNAEQFAEISGKLDFQDLLDAEGSYIYAVWYKSVYTGENFHLWARMICQEILGDPDATFGDLNKAISDPEHPYHHSGLKHLIVTATQLLNDGTSKTVAFSTKDETTHAVKIADAVRASMSIPGIYRPWQIKGTDGKVWGTFVDGGVLNNFPINLLDEKSYAATHLGIKYDLVQQLSSTGPVQVNPCSIGFTFADDLKYLDPDITPLTEHLQAQIKEKAVKLEKQEEAKPVEQSAVGILALGTNIYQAFFGQRKAEALFEKYAHHKGNVVQMYPEGIGLMDFNADKKIIDRAAKTAGESTLLTFKKKDGTKSYDGKLVTVDTLPLEKYLSVLESELEKYQIKELSDQFDISKLKQNVTLQFLAAKIMEGLANRPDKSISAESFLAIKIGELRDKKIKEAKLTAAFNQRVQNVIGEHESLEKLQSLILPDNSKDKQFVNLLQGQLTRVIEQCCAPIDTQGGKTLLQVAIARGNYDLLNEMLVLLKKAYAHRQEQKKQPKAGMGFSDIINRINGGLLNSIIRADIGDHKKDMCLGELKKISECNPLEENAEGLTSLHVAVLSQKSDMLKTVLAFTSDTYIYQRTYSTHHLDGSIKSKESLFEFILRQKNTPCLLSLLDDQTNFKKIFYHNQPCNGFTMQERLAKYTVDNNCPELWSVFYQKYTGKQDIGEYYKKQALESLATKEKALSQQQQLQQGKIAKERELQDKFRALFTGENAEHNLIDIKKLEALSAEDLKAIIGMSFQENTDANGLNVLCNACRMGQFDAVNLIIEKLEQPPKTDLLKFLTEKSRDKAPLIWAIESGERSMDGAKKIVELLVKKGIILNHIHEAGSKDQSCAITLAAKLGHNPLVSTLFPHIRTRQTPDGEKKEVLHYLALNPNTTPEEFHNAFYKNFGVSGYNFPKLNVVDMYGKTPFHYLIDNDRWDIFEYLLKTNVPRGNTRLYSDSPITLEECGVFNGAKDYNKTDFYAQMGLLEYGILTNKIELCEKFAAKFANGRGLEMLASAKKKVSSAPSLPPEPDVKRVSPVLVKRESSSRVETPPQQASTPADSTIKPKQ
jgi:predicted acylesterase/phospholipase RssA/ankyrin repeat protein